jgi:hypothetical protein
VILILILEISMTRSLQSYNRNYLKIKVWKPASPLGSKTELDVGGSHDHSGLFILL